MAGVAPSEIDLIVYGGITFEMFCPSHLRAHSGSTSDSEPPAEYSIHSNCTSTYKALQLATDQLAMGRYNTALIASAQLSSPFLRAEFYNQEIIEKSQILLRWFLSDGAGALVLTTDPDRVRKPRIPAASSTPTWSRWASASAPTCTAWSADIA